MDSKSQNVIVCVLAGAALFVAVWMLLKPSGGHRSREGFVVAGGLNHLDSIDTYPPVGHDMVKPDIPYLGQPVESSLDQAYGIPSAGQRYDALLASNGEPISPAALPQFNVDVVNPSNFNAQVQLRLPMKNRQFLSSDPYRGDVQILRSPHSCVIDTSIYANRDSLRYDAFWSPYSNLARFQAPMAKATACATASGGTICDTC